MITVQVTYTIQEAYITQNKGRIALFLEDFKKLDPSLFTYSVFQKENSNTFVHLSQYQNPEIQQVILNTPSFLQFQEQRDKNLLSQPTIEIFNWVGDSK